MPGIGAANNDVTRINIEEAAAPATPTTGNAYLYVKTDGLVYAKNDAGTEYDLTGTALPSTTITDLLLAADTELTIATGAVTATQSNHTIDTESDAASDDLDTISGGAADQLLVIRANNTARTVVVKHGTGNIQTIGAVDISLDTTEKALLLFYDGANWLVIGDYGDYGQFALLAGRAGGQSLTGGTASGEDLTLASTAHATKGSVFLGSSSLFELDETSGQLKVPTTGSGAGLLMGGDVQLYRSAADTLYTPDKVQILDHMAVGPNASISTTIGLYQNEIVDQTSGTYVGFQSLERLAPSAPSSATVYGVWGIGYADGAQNVTGSVRGFLGTGSNIGSADVSSVYGGFMQATASGAGTTSIATAVFAQVVRSGAGAITVGTLFDGSVSLTAGTIGTLVGLNLPDITAGGTNYAIRTRAGNIVFNDNGDASTDIRIEGDTDANLFITDASSDTAGIGIAAGSHLGKLHIDQSNATGAKPVLVLDQGDLSEPFIRLIGQSAADNSQSFADAADLATPGSIAGWFKVYVQDDAGTGPITDGDYWIPLYATPTA